MSDNAAFGVSFTPEEDAFFVSGGESPISDTGSDNAGGDSSVTNTGGEGGDGGNKSAAPDKQSDKAPQNVPLAALQEERGKRKAEAEARRKLETELAEMRGKFSILDRLNQKPGEVEGEKPGAVPKPEDDIFGAVNALQKQIADDKKAQADAEAAATNHRTFVGKYQADAQTFESTNKDYRAAYQFLMQSRAAELQAIGYSDPMELHRAIIADETAIAERAFAAGKSPAEMIYSLAKQRGYKLADPAADETAKKAAADKAAAEAAAKLDTIERGQNSNKSLSNTGGGSGENEMTAERLIGLPMDEFEAWVNKNPAKAKRIMGG